MGMEQMPGGGNVEHESPQKGEFSKNKLEQTADVMSEVRLMIENAVESATESAERKKGEASPERILENGARSDLEKEIKQANKILEKIGGGAEINEEESREIDKTLEGLLRRKKRLEEIEENNAKYPERMREFKDDEDNAEKIRDVKSFFRDISPEMMKNDSEKTLNEIKDILLKFSDLVVEGAAKMKPDRLDYPFLQDIFGCVLDGGYISKTREKLFNIKNGLYRPDTKDPKNQKYDGGDGWLKREDETGEIGVLFDIEGHGENTSNRKIFMGRIFEAMESAPEDKRADYMVRIDSALENVTHAGGKTVSTYERVRVETLGNDKIVSGEFYGDSIFLVFDPNEEKFFHRGLSSKGREDLFSKIEEKNKESKGGNFGTTNIGHGMISLIGKALPYKEVFSKDAEVILASDGVGDITMEYKGGKNFIQILEDFVGTRKNSPNLKLVDYLKNSVLEAEKIADDITIMEVGRTKT